MRPAFLLDTSVVIKWFHHVGESEVEAAEWHLLARRAGAIDTYLLDLGMYELGNVLVRSLGRSASATTTVLAAARALCGPPLSLSADGLADAAILAETQRLTFYDAAFVAAAREHGLTLLSADRRLVASGHAESLTDSVATLRGESRAHRGLPAASESRSPFGAPRTPPISDDGPCACGRSHKETVSRDSSRPWRQSAS